MVAETGCCAVVKRLAADIVSELISNLLSDMFNHASI